MVIVDSWRNHLAFSLIFEFIFLILTFNFLNWFHDYTFENILILLIILFVSPLVMDLDHRNSKLREGLTFAGLMLGLFGVILYYINIDVDLILIYGIIIASAGYMIQYVFTHRGFTHSILFCVIYAGLTLLLTKNIQFASLALLGCYTHLIFDKIPFKPV